MKRISFVFCLVFATSVYAQSPASGPAQTHSSPQEASKPLAAPVPNADLKAKVFKAMLQVNQARESAQATEADLAAKQKAWQDTVSDLSKFCGDKFEAQLDKAGDPICAVKPDAPKPAPPVVRSE